jgi:hypothetical protein
VGECKEGKLTSTCWRGQGLSPLMRLSVPSASSIAPLDLHAQWEASACMHQPVMALC